MQEEKLQDEIVKYMKQFDMIRESKETEEYIIMPICFKIIGKYPKDFTWTGWHPNDLCYKVPILKTEEEFWEWDGRSDSTTESVNEVKDVPDAFKQWVGTNSKRIVDAKKKGTLPYFLKDNPLYLK